MTRLLLIASFSVLFAACQQASAEKTEPLAEPVIQKQSFESEKTIVPIEEVPSFQDQVTIEDWATDLKEPWGIHFIADNTALVTEKRGKLWQVSSDNRIEVKGIPASVDKRQGGLLDVATDPDYAENGWVYLSFTHADAESPKNLMTKIVRGKIQDGKWIAEQSLFQARSEDYLDTGFHLSLIHI